MKKKCLTNEVRNVVSITESSSGFRAGKIDPIVRMVGLMRRPQVLRVIQIVIVADI